jgi:SAM-dependent methyltransferase
MDWNALASAWVADEAMLEHLHGPLCRTLVAAVDPRAGDQVVDIGFGTGATLAAFANAVGGEGHVLGLDIAEGMVARAAERIAEHGHVEVLCGDAASHDFDEGRADLLVSLFGLMFFDEPETAFANIARALRPGGRMVFVAWGPGPNNPWFGVPRAALDDRLGPLPPPDPAAPGPLALADVDRVAAILAAAGLDLAQVSDLTQPLAPLGSPRDAAEHMMRISALSGQIAALGGDDADRAAIVDGMERGFAAFMTAEGLRVPSHQRIFDARRPH